MAPINHNPENFSRVFAQYVKAIIQLLVWATIGFAFMGATYVAARAVWVAVKAILNALGIPN